MNIPTPEDTFPSWASYWITQGFSILPLWSVIGDQCECGKVNCPKPGKHPRGITWDRATMEPGQIREWWSLWPHANIGGIIPPDMVILDVDPRNGGRESFAALIKEHGDLPPTRAHKTGGNGGHILFRIPRGTPVSVSSLGAGLDIKKPGEMLVLPPSLHASGERYGIASDALRSDAPAWFIALITEEKKKEPFTVPGKIKDGARNTTLFKLGCSLKKKGISDAGIVATLREENTARCDPPLPEGEIKSIGESVSKYQPGDYTTNDSRTLPDLTGTQAPENPRLTMNLPGFVQDYMIYMRRQTDSYQEYQHAGAIALLAAVVNKRASLDLTIGTIHTNVWPFLLGISTVSRKTTACVYVSDFLKDASLYWLILAYPGSPEGFIEDLEGADRANGENNIGHGILVQDEAAGVMGTMQKKYMADMRDFFCSLYDCRPIVRRIRSGQRKGKKSVFKIDDPYLNLFWATTPQNFQTHSTLEDLTSGWLLRFLYYYPNYPRTMQNVRTKTTEDIDRHNAILKQIMNLDTFFREHVVSFQLSIAGADRYNSWKLERINAMQSTMEDDRGVFDRLSIYALKLAMLYTVGRPEFLAEQKDRPGITLQVDISDPCLDEAIRQVDEYFHPVSGIVLKLVGRNEEKNMLDRVVGSLSRAGGCLTRTKLMQRVHIKRKDLDETLEALYEAKEIEVGKMGGEVCYKLLITLV